MSKYEELKYVLSGATDWGYEYAKKEDVEAAFAELEERHAMELDQWVLELRKKKLENDRLKKDIDTLKTAWEQSQSALSTIAALKLAAEEKHRASRMALWLARARSAHNAAMMWEILSDVFLNYAQFTIDFKCIGDPNVTEFQMFRGCMDWMKIYENVERKCRAKAKEYR